MAGALGAHLRAYCTLVPTKRAAETRFTTQQDAFLKGSPT